MRLQIGLGQVAEVMATSVLTQGAMSLQNTLSASCALAVTFVTAAFDVSRSLSTNDVLTSDEPAINSLTGILMNGVLTFLVTFIAWNLLVARRLRSTADQIRAIKPGVRCHPESSLPHDEFSPVLAASYDLACRQAIATTQSAENQLCSLRVIGQGLLRRTTLATEHISSLLLILQIAHEYGQPIPGSAIHNLALVEKDLRGVQKDLDDQLLGSLDTASLPLEPRISKDVPVRLPREWTQRDSDGSFAAAGLRINTKNADHKAKS